MVKVGIPRALLYYQYYPMWKTFFDELGAEVVVSPPTTQATLSAGSSRVVADTCLPVKVFCGHVLALVENCDYIFVPALRSVKSRIYNCSKFLGLPDMTRAVIPECPPILDIDIDINKGKRRLYREIYRLGRHLSWSPLKVRKAALAAWQAHREYKEMMVNESLAPPQAITRIYGEEEPPTNPDDSPAIALIGHPYLLYDELINHRLIHRLEQAGYRVLTPEMLTPEQMETAITRLTGQPYWTYEEEVVGSGGHYLESGVEGAIGVIAFGCGPDSLMMDMVQRQAIRLKTTPFMSLTLEEHTGEAGVVTRLEAFLDMIQRRKRKEAKLCV
jgi:predicted nucleotide-binding protein (sugar kinase/HSP70/actin superfamily)